MVKSACSLCSVLLWCGGFCLGFVDLILENNFYEKPILRRFFVCCFSCLSKPKFRLCSLAFVSSLA
jgi:hypothetical protein